MTASRIDPAILLPSAETGKALVPTDFYNVVIAAINQHADDIDSPPSSGKFITPEQYGAKGDGSTNDLAALKAMDADILAGRVPAFVRFDAKTYVIGQDGGNAYCWNVLSSNAIFDGVPGATWLKAAPGLPGSSVPLIKHELTSNIMWRGMGFDGNWGNAYTSIAEASSNTSAGSSTINVVSTAGFPSPSGTIFVQSSSGTQTITYTGTTATTFTGCAGGSGTLIRGGFVGYINAANNGINHGNQTDPKNYLLFTRGVSGFTLQNCKLRQCYGDFVWVGNSTVTKTIFDTNIRIINCDMDTSARHGISINGGTDGVIVEGCRITNVWGNPLFSQTNQWPVRNVKVSRAFMSGWWDSSHGGGTGGSGMCAVDFESGGYDMLGNANRGWSITDCVLMGGNSFSGMWDFTFERNVCVSDWATGGPPSCLIQAGGGDIRTNNNWIYNRSTVNNLGVQGDATTGAIVIYNYGSGVDGNNNVTSYNPSSVQVRGNTIHTRNGRHGIVLNSPGGAIKNATGTATSVGLTTLADTGATWVVNEWKGCTVRIGTAMASVISNTATTLTLDTIDNSTGTAWQNYYGGYAVTPSTGTYLLHRNTGTVDVWANEIDCQDDGFGAGGRGIDLSTSNANQGMRVRIRGNQLRSCKPDGIYCKFAASGVIYALLEITDNYGWDDQGTPTFTNLVTFLNTPAVVAGGFIYGGNIQGENVTNADSGISTGTWLERAGQQQRLAGFGAPTMSAPKGSTYTRRDGGAGTTFYVNESGSTTWAGK